MATANTHTELNEIQVSLLRLFNRPMTENETRELKQVLLSHYHEQLNGEVSKIIEEKNYSQNDFDDMLNANS